jgi:histone H3/H4
MSEEASVSSPPPEPSLKRKRRMSSKRDFEKMQKGTLKSSRPLLCIPRASFHRLVSEILSSCNGDLRIQGDAIDVLREEAEMLVVDRFKRCARLAEYCGRDTVRSGDWTFVHDDESVRELPYSGRS